MFFMMDFTLQAPLAPYGDAQRYDVQKLKTVLNHLGYYKPNAQTGLDDEMREPALFAALNVFQRDRGIEPYNHVFPRDETALALDEAVRAIPKSQRYIWRTVGDGDVRGSHAEREGQVFTWNEPPEGGHPGEDFNCRCWAEPVPGDANSMPSRRDGFAPAAGLQVERNDLFAPLIDPLSGRANPSVSPLDLIGGGIVLVQAGRVVIGTSINVIAGRAMLQNPRVFTGSAAAILTARFRRTDWIDETPLRQLQSKFKHAKDLGMKGNYNKKNLEVFKSKLKEHVRSKDTIIIRGTYQRTEKMIHYYNPKTRINIMREPNGNLRSVWELKPKQEFHILKDKNIGGN